MKTNVCILLLAMTALGSCVENKEKSRSITDIWTNKVDSTEQIHIIRCYSGGKLIALYRSTSYEISQPSNSIYINFKDSSITWNGDFLVRTVKTK